MNSLTSRSALVAGHIVIGLLYAFILLALWQADPGIAAESRLMENLQAASLFLVIVLSLVNLAPLGRKPPAYVSAGMAVFFLTLFMREIELKNLDLPAILITLGSGTGKNVLLSLLWAGVLVSVVRNRQRLKQDALTVLRSPLIYYLLTAAVFYIIGEALDKKLLPVANPKGSSGRRRRSVWPPSGALWERRSGRSATSATGRMTNDLNERTNDQ